MRRLLHALTIEVPDINSVLLDAWHSSKARNGRIPCKMSLAKPTASRSIPITRPNGPGPVMPAAVAMCFYRLLLSRCSDCMQTGPTGDRPVHPYSTELKSNSGGRKTVDYLYMMLMMMILTTVLVMITIPILCRPCGVPAKLGVCQITSYQF